jgi:hypothetical protein
MERMARKSKTQYLTESIVGQHLALSVAAHLARTQLIPDPLTPYDGQHMSETIDLVANALARVVPLYVSDPKLGAPRELSEAEREGATIKRGATLLALRDGRTLSSVSIKRGDLRQAIAILKAIGIPELVRRAPPIPTPEPAREPRVPLAAQIGEIEKLLQRPLLSQEISKANRLLVALARHAPNGHLSNIAMRLMSAAHDAASSRGEAQEVRVLLARLRVAAEETDRA